MVKAGTKAFEAIMELVKAIEVGEDHQPCLGGGGLGVRRLRPHRGLVDGLVRALGEARPICLS